MEINGGIHTIEGDVEHLDAHGGVLYVNGKVGTLVHHGGVMYDQRPSNRVQYVTDKVTDSERRQYRELICKLEERLRDSELEVLMLRGKISKEGDAEIPPDDVLVAKIEHLQHELEQERADRKREVDELNYRLETTLRELNGYHRDYNEAVRYEQALSVNDEMFDVLFTLINLYPFTTDGDLAFEFGIKTTDVKTIAKILKLVKSPEKRHEAVEYLRKQHIEFVERRGGDQSKLKKKKPRINEKGKKTINRSDYPQ